MEWVEVRQQVEEELRKIEALISSIRALLESIPPTLLVEAKQPVDYPGFRGSDERTFLVAVYRAYGLDTRTINILTHKYARGQNPIWPQDLWRMSNDQLLGLRGMGVKRVQLIRQTIMDNQLTIEQVEYLEKAGLYFSQS